LISFSDSTLTASVPRCVVNEQPALPSFMYVVVVER
jgi:hypothetical protein